MCWILSNLLLNQIFNMTAVITDMLELKVGFLFPTVLRELSVEQNYVSGKLILKSATKNIIYMSVYINLIKWNEEKVERITKPR